MASLIHLLIAAISVVLASLTFTIDAYAYGTVSYTYSQTPNTQDQGPKQVEEKPKPIVEKPHEEHGDNGLEKPNVDTNPNIEKLRTGSPWQKLEPILEKKKPREAEIYNTIGIQGIVYCKSGAKLLPIQGATTKITCWAKNKNGYESHIFTTFSKTTDKKGYFLATLPVSELQSKSKLFKCSAFLDKSPLESCNVPTDANKGLSGALPYSASQLLPNSKMKLYSVGPFIYTSTKPKMIDEGY